MCASLSYTHYWYEVGMWKESAWMRNIMIGLCAQSDIKLFCRRMDAGDEETHLMQRIAARFTTPELFYLTHYNINSSGTVAT